MFVRPFVRVSQAWHLTTTATARPWLSTSTPPTIRSSSSWSFTSWHPFLLCIEAQPRLADQRGNCSCTSICDWPNSWIYWHNSCVNMGMIVYRDAGLVIVSGSCKARCTPCPTFSSFISCPVARGFPRTTLRTSGNQGVEDKKCNLFCLDLQK